MRVRVRFSKQGKIRFTSHRDVARIWERAIRRVQLPIAYSEGISPRPKVHFGLALTTGHESLGEYLDIDLQPDALEQVNVDLWPQLLSPALPVGIDVQAASTISTGMESLQQAVTSCSWRLEVTGGEQDELAEAVERVLAAPQLITTRQRKGADVTDDLRPYILDLAVAGTSEDGVVLDAHVATQPRGLRPSELIATLGESVGERRVCRTHQWMQLDGALREPLPLAAQPEPQVLVGAATASSAPHASERAS